MVNIFLAVGQEKERRNSMKQWLSTKEKCILRDLIKLEIKSLDSPIKKKPFKKKPFFKKKFFKKPAVI